MNVKIVIWSFLLLLLVTACGSSTDVASLTPAQLNEQINNKTAPFILDVRTPQEYLDGHVPTSVLIYYNDVDANLDKLPQDKSSPIIVYCETGIRARMAIHSLEEAGYTNLLRLDGDMSGWRNAKLPVSVM